MGESEAAGSDKIEFVFLDREGVLNRKPREGQYVTGWEDFELLPGVEEALARLTASGRKLILVTNQRCVALGLCRESDVRALHQRLQQHLEERGAALDAIYFCPHGEGECNCRKPSTGMFDQAFCDFPQAHSQNSVMIGDSLSDIEAARELGMRSIFISGDAERQKPGTVEAAAMATASAKSLQEGVERHILRRVP